MITRSEVLQRRRRKEANKERQSRLTSSTSLAVAKCFAECPGIRDIVISKEVVC